MKKHSLVSLGLLGLAFSGAASATIIDFNNLAHNNCLPKAVNPIHADGYVVSNSYSFWGWGGAYGLEVFSRRHAYQADKGYAAVAIKDVNSTTTLKREDGSLFDFLSIDLADFYNDGKASVWEFIFTKADGSQDSQKLSLDRLVGLETFSFDQTGLLNVTWRTLATSSGGRCGGSTNYGGQFDNIHVDKWTPPTPPPPAPVPLPGAALLFGSSLLGLTGLFGRRRNRAS